MRYLNQLEYENIPYPTNAEDPTSDYAVKGNIRMAGCGLCSICMVVDSLCAIPFSLEECRDLSVSVKANHTVGTDMQVLAPAVAEMFHLSLQETDDPAQLADCLHSGGAAVVHVGGDHDEHIGIFSDVGHYIVAIGESDGEFCLLDPAWRPDKYLSEPRRSKVRQQDIYLYASADTLQLDTVTRTPAYYLFNKAER